MQPTPAQQGTAKAQGALAAGTFTHTPRPAKTPEPGPHTWQRRYGPDGDSGHAMRARHDERQAHFCSVEVFRDAGEDVAEISLTLGNYAKAGMTVRLTPAELRELAARALDAAHDIEANPAATLARTQQGGAA